MHNTHVSNKRRISSFLILAGVFAALLIAMSGCRNIFLEEMFNHPKATTPGHASITAMKVGTQNLVLSRRIFTLAYTDIAPSPGDEIPIQAALAGRRLDVEFVLYDPEENKASLLTPAVNGTIWAVSVTLKESKTILLTIKVNAGRPDEVSYELTLERLIGSADNSLLNLKISNSAKFVEFTDDGIDHVPSIMTPAYAPLGYPDAVTIEATVVFNDIADGGNHAKVSSADATFREMGNDVWTATGVAMPIPGETKYVKFQVKVPRGAIKSYTIELYRPAAYFVAATGDDANSGEYSSAPFKTLAKAVDVVTGDTGSHTKPDFKLKNITVIGELNEISEQSSSGNGVFIIQDAGKITISGMNGGALKRTADGAKKRVVYVNGATSNITFRDITISGGNATSGGGGICVGASANVLLGEGTVVTGNSAMGGGVYATIGAILTLDGGVISSNNGSSGGGVCVGGSFVMNSGRIVLNKATNGNGAAVWLPGTPAQFTMNGGEILMNEVVDSNPFDSTEYYGGGVCIFDGATFTMNGGTISGNAAKTGMGVGVYQAGTFKMSNQAVVGNNDDVRLVSGKKIQLLGNGTAADMTAAALQYGATITPPSYEMGTQLLAVDDLGNALNGTTDLRYGRFFVTPNGANPYAIDKFGQLCNGMFYLSANGDDANDGMTMGTAFKTLRKAVAEVKKINISVVVVDGKLDAISEQPPVDARSVFVLDNVGELSFKGSKYDAEFCGTNGKRVFEITGNSNVNFEQIKITGGRDQDGAGMYLVGAGVNVTLGVGTEVSDNYGDSLGGGVYIKGADLTLSAGTIKENDTPEGSGIYLEGGSFTMIGGSIDHNHGNWGSGIYIHSGEATLGYGASILNNWIEGDYGAGVYVSGGTLTMTGGEINGNHDYRGTPANVYGEVGGTIDIRTATPITTTHGGDIPCNTHPGHNVWQ